MELDLLIALRVIRRRRVRRLQDAIRRRNWEIRRLRDTSNPFEIPEEIFRGRYRLSRQDARDLIEELRPHMAQPQRRTAIPIHLQVLVALHFFGHGSYQRSVATDRTTVMSQPSVSLRINAVVEALNVPEVLVRNIQFPSTRAQRQAVMNRNFQRSSIPGVLGYVDGTHVLIVAPHIHEEQYVNRHQTHSLNVQVTCDSDMMILDVFPNYPGATQDSFIWTNSPLRRKMEELYRANEQCWLLADSGYPLQPWIMVPYANPIPGSREANYNDAARRDPLATSALGAL